MGFNERRLLYLNIVFVFVVIVMNYFRLVFKNSRAIKMESQFLLATNPSLRLSFEKFGHSHV